MGCGRSNNAPHTPKDAPVLVPAACECYLQGTDSAGMIKLRILREEAILDYVLGPKASVLIRGPHLPCHTRQWPQKGQVLSLTPSYRAETLCPLSLHARPTLNQPLTLLHLAGHSFWGITGRIWDPKTRGPDNAGPS